MPNYNLGGKGPPKIKLDDGTIINLPEPNGPARKGIEKYKFTPEDLNSYRSENDKRIVVGRKFLFGANLSWVSGSKNVLYNLYKAQSNTSFTFWPHNEKINISFRVRVEGEVDHEYIEGVLNHPGGYSIRIELAGTEYIDAPFEGALEADTGYGTNWGTDVGNQSP